MIVIMLHAAGEYN